MPLLGLAGVHDEDTPDGEGLISEFYNDLHGYALDVGRWHALRLAAPKKGAKQGGGAAKGGDKGGEGRRHG